MNRKCALLVLLFTCACLKYEVVPLEFENSGKENFFLESDNNVIVLPENEESSTEGFHNVGSSEEHFGQSEDRILTGMFGMMHKTVKRYHCSVEGRGFIPNNGLFCFHFFCTGHRYKTQ